MRNLESEEKTETKTQTLAKERRNNSHSFKHKNHWPFFPHKLSRFSPCYMLVYPSRVSCSAINYLNLAYSRHWRSQCNAVAVGQALRYMTVADGSIRPMSHGWSRQARPDEGCSNTLQVDSRNVHVSRDGLCSFRQWTLLNILRLFEIYQYCQIVCQFARKFVRPSVRSYVLTSVRSSVRPSFRLTFRPSVCPSVRPFIHPSVCPSVRSFVLPSVRPTVRPSVRLSVHQSVRPSARPSVRPSARQSVGPSVRPTRPSVCPFCQHVILPADNP